VAVLFADVALPVPLFRTFTYGVPEEFRDRIAPGMRVLVPFGRSTLSGVVVGLTDRSEVRGIKPLRDLLDRQATFTDDLLGLTRWISDYYLAPWGDVLRAATPQGLSIEGHRTVCLKDRAVLATALAERLGKTQRALLELLRDGSTISFLTIQNKLHVASVASSVASLEARGWVKVQDTLKRPTVSVRAVPYVRLSDAGRQALERSAPERTPRGLKTLRKYADVLADAGTVSLRDAAEQTEISVASLRTLVKRGHLELDQREEIRDPYAGSDEVPPSLTLTDRQRAAVEVLQSALSERAFQPFLLHGVTGSGKTQVYIEALRRALELGRTAIVLVPEISLTPQTVRRFRSHFGDDVAVMHSQLSVGERYDAWRRARDGRAKIVIGPRSAVFAPLEHLGLIVVDEEHDSSYKQYDAVPRYQGRDTAIVRAKLNHAVVLLGSATPSMESYANAKAGKFRLIELPDRIDHATMPEVKLVDMVLERKRRFEEVKKQVKEKGGAFPKTLGPMSISLTMRDEITKRLEKKEGVILLQNRRGFAHVLECLECGHTERCKNCDVTMTYHLKTHDLRCHYCGARRPASAKASAGTAAAQACPSCRVGEMKQLSFGTQQVHEELQALFPQAKILRMDRDTTRRKGSHESILRRFGSGEGQILLGTQMVAKGLDFPHVTLVGVVSAETQLLLPDFRSAETTFQLLTQVAGRSGRSTLRGEVLIQTVQPQHYSLIHASSHDFNSFFAEEIRFRTELRYPPMTRLVLIEFTGLQESAVERRSQDVAKMLRQAVSQGEEVLGPAEPPIARLRNLYRRHILIKRDRRLDAMSGALRELIVALVGERQEKGTGDVRVSVDVDPYGMM
jgi:primosomal protein N' (replication factor Y)